MQKAPDTQLAKRILDQYKLGAVRIFPAQTGYRNASYKVLCEDGAVLNLMIFKGEPKSLQTIKAADEAAAVLARHGLPARLRARQRLIKLSAPVWQHDRYAGLYNYLSGHTISWEAYGKDHLKLLGRAMGAMHTAWSAEASSASASSQRSMYAVSQSLLQRMEVYFQRPEVKLALASKLGLKLKPNFDLYERAVAAGRHLTAQHTLHMDFVRSNVLFSETEDGALSLGNLSITGIIDFEKAACGSPLFDLARTLAFLTVDCKYKPPEKIRKYFLYSGYEKRGGARIPRARLRVDGSPTLLLDVYVQFFLLHDFYKFLRHNPYESLPQNEHFVRTRSILEGFGMLE